MRTTGLMFCLAGAALATGCGGAGGQRSMRLDATQGIVVSDAASVEVLPAFMCSGSAPVTFDCTMPFPLHPDGHVTDFSYREWNAGSGHWCDESGFHGSIYSYTNTQITADTHSQTVNTDDSSLHISLSVSAGQYGGGGLQFDGGCVDVSAYSGVQFTAAVVSGSLTPCPLQLQIQTFDQRPNKQNPGTPNGGCDQSTTSCYNFPAATNIAVSSTDAKNPSLIMLPFSSFSRISGALNQVVGLQWQVNASAACTVELAFSNIAFTPAPASPEPGDDGGTD